LYIREIAAFSKLKGGAELEAFEPLFFSHMLLALDHYFNSPSTPKPFRRSRMLSLPK
jgi:hypothetical protein